MAGDSAGRQQGDGGDAFHRLAGIAFLDVLLRLFRRRLVVPIRLRFRDQTHCSAGTEHRLRHLQVAVYQAHR